MVTDMTVDQLIESCPVYKDVMRPFSCGVIALDKQDWRNLCTSEFLKYFTDNPEGETNKYRWITVKVDSLINLKIFTARE